MNDIRTVINLAAVALLAGCTWVKDTPGGTKVRVLAANEVASCTEIGKTQVSLADKVLGIKRSATKVQLELETLARNSAADMGGDTVVAVAPPNEGHQIYNVYRCIAAPSHR
jgi:hypothetical protein